MTCRPLILQQQGSSHLPAGDNLVAARMISKGREGQGGKGEQRLSQFPRERAHLTERALQLPEEVVILQGVRVIVDVVHAKLEPLHHLEIVVEHKLLGELGVQTVEDHLCAAKLVPKTAQIYQSCQVIQNFGLINYRINYNLLIYLVTFSTQVCERSPNEEFEFEDIIQ